MNKFIDIKHPLVPKTDSMLWEVFAIHWQQLFIDQSMQYLQGTDCVGI